MAEYFTKDGEEYKKVDDNLLTQADVDNVIEKRLERERSKFADYDSLKEKADKVDSIKSSFDEQLKEKDTKLSDFEKQLGQAKLQTDKVKIVHEFKLSDELSEFVTGESVSEMRERAEKLSKGMKVTGVNIDKKEKPQDKASDSKALAGKLFGNKKADD